MRILIVDDLPVARKLIAGCLTSLRGAEIHEAASLSEARQLLSRHLFDVALIDLRLDERDTANSDGLTLVQELRDRGTAVPIVVTGANDMQEIRRAIRAGAYTYILKDELCEELVLPVLADLQSRRSLEHEVLHLHGLVGRSPSMERLRRQLKKVAAADAPVLLLGPTGSGKELVARAIHALSSRRDQPLVAVNCGAFTESLVEAQLFGHERGTFSGAEKAREGYLAETRRGTLFLDEHAELPAPLQSKLLRVLENRSYRVLGAASDSLFEGRLIAATHVDLAARVAAGRFRADLYYRLEVLTVRLPSLDERREDIPALVEHLAREAPRRLRYSDEALAALVRMDWPGNVRQLRNLIHRLAVFADHEVVSAADVELHMTEISAERPLTVAHPETAPRPVDSALFHGISAMNPRRENIQHLMQNQVRLLESKGYDTDSICRIMGIARATLFRIKAGKE